MFFSTLVLLFLFVGFYYLSTDTPPSFDGYMIELWKARFETFIKANYFEMWDILNNSNFIHTFSFNDEVLNKLNLYWIEEDMRKVKLGFTLKHIFINSLSSKEFYYVFTCDSTKEVWDTL